MSARHYRVVAILALGAWISIASPARADSDPFGRLPAPAGPVATGGGGCGSCQDPASNIFEVEYVGAELWELATHGTLFRTSDCVTRETIAIQGFRGLASGLAYDTRRNLLVVADLLLDEVLLVDFSGNVIRTLDAPTGDIIGAAYDSTRDLYWFPDIETQQIVSLSGASGLPGPVFTAPIGSRIAGAAFDVTRDAIVYNGRNQQKSFFISAKTGELIASLPMGVTGVNKGEGLAIAPDGGVWLHDTDSQSVVCSGNVDDVTGTSSTTWGRLKLLYR